MIPALRPKLELLSPALTDRILDEAFLILGRDGVFFENAEARALFREAGQSVDDNAQRVRLSRDVVERALATTPASLTLYDRSGEASFFVGGDEVHFDPGSSGTRILDHDTLRERRPEPAELGAIARLTAVLEHLHFPSKSLVPADGPGAIADE